MTPEITIRGIIVEDESLYRELLKTALDSLPQFEIVGSFADAQSALAAAPALKPDVALLDIELGEGLNGIELGLHLRKILPHLGIVILSNHTNPWLLAAVPEESMEGWSYLLKSEVKDLATLARVIVGATQGWVVFSPQIIQRARTHGHSPLSRLTPRQREVLELIAKGYSNAGIAEQLGISRKTVENYINELYGQLGIDPRDGSHQARVKAALMFLGYQGKSS